MEVEIKAITYDPEYFISNSFVNNMINKFLANETHKATRTTIYLKGNKQNTLMNLGRKDYEPANHNICRMCV